MTHILKLLLVVGRYMGLIFHLSSNFFDRRESQTHFVLARESIIAITVLTVNHELEFREFFGGQNFLLVYAFAL